MKKTTKNSLILAQNKAKWALKTATLALFLANFISPNIALAATLGNLGVFDQYDSTSTVNTTPATAADFGGKDGQTGEHTLSESTAAKIFKRLPAPNKVVSGLITVYSSTPDQTDDTPFIGASGKRVYDGMIAVNGYPFGTKIKIPALYGDKIFTVDDRMNKRYGNTNFDIWMDAPIKELRKLGARRAQVEIYFPAKELAVK